MRYFLVAVVITMARGQELPVYPDIPGPPPLEPPVGSPADPNGGLPVNPNAGSPAGPSTVPPSDPDAGSLADPLFPSPVGPNPPPVPGGPGLRSRSQLPNLPVTTEPPRSLPPPTTFDTYMVGVPSCIRPGHLFDVFVDIRKGVNPTTVVVELYNKTTGQVYASDQDIVYKGNPKILTLQTPQDLPRPWRTGYVIRVTGSGQDVTFVNETIVLFADQNVTGFIQTDKAVYEPGDTVQYRIFSLLPDLKINKEAYNLPILDAHNNKIREDSNLTHPSGLIRGSLTLSDEPLFGVWWMEVSLPGRSISNNFFRRFVVREYVLPRIEVTVTPPPYIYVNQSTVEVDITAKYTFGDDVRGTLLVTANISPWWPQHEGDTLPLLQRTLTGFVGRTTLSFLTADILSLRHSDIILSSLDVKAKITESLTGNVVSGTGRTTILRTAEKLEYLSSNSRIFKPGLDFKVFAKLSQQDGRPVVSTPGDITVTADFTHQVKHSAEATFSMDPPRVPDAPPVESAFKRSPICSTEDTTQIRVGFRVLQDGILEISLPTVPENARRLRIKSTYKGKSVSWSALRASSPSNSHLQIKLAKDNPKPGDIVSIQLKSNVDIDSFSLMVLSGGRIAMAHEEKRRVKGREFNTTFAIRHAMAPRASVLAFYRTATGEIVADALDFNVQDPFKTKVSIGFSPEEVQPGDDVTMTVVTAPNSLVATLVLDKKVILRKTGTDVTEKEVSDGLQFFGCGSYHGGQNAESVFWGARLTVMTDSLRNRFHNMPTGAFASGRFTASEILGRPLAFSAPRNTDFAAIQLGTIRTKFPDTWLFMVGVADSSGVLNITTTAPDSITDWEATALAFNHLDGLGMTTKPGKLTVVKPFVANLVLPYSVILGEELFLQVNVFNYLRTNQTVVVELHGSTSYMSLDIDEAGNEVLVAGARTQTLTIPSSISKSVVFPIRPVVVGDILISVTTRSAAAADALTKTLRVDLEGVPDVYNFIVLVNLTESSTYNTTRAISYPDQVVKDSHKLGVKLTGDVLGSTLANLANLVRLPYGCGEQNMVNFAPTVFVSRYLETVGQLTGQRRADALNFISLSYQRQTKYIRYDGSYSAFGRRDEFDNLWLTAFVVKSLSTAASQGLLVLDKRTLNSAYSFILSQQNRFGGFQNKGTIHNNRLTRENGQGVALTAYVLTALLENPPSDMNFTDPIARAQQFVEDTVESSTDLYELAIGAYALALAGSSQVDGVLSRLESRATTKDGFTYWEVEREPEYIWEPPRRQTNAASIETTSYVCLVYALRKDISKMAQCLTYLVGQQNDQGGYVSTQDTVVAIQALSAIAPSFYSPTQSGSLSVEAGGSTASFTVDDANRFDLQQAVLPASAKRVTVRGTGSGVFLLSLSVRYNVVADLIQPAFNVTATLTRDTPTAINLTVCVRYVIGPTSSMANIEVRLPTDFALTVDSKYNLLTITKRVEVFDGKVILYLDQITNDGVCLSLTATGIGNINKPKPNSVRVFDYYNPDKSGLTFYTMRSLEGGFCDVVLCSKDLTGCSANCSKRSRK